MTDTRFSDSQAHVVLITGPSGAGRSTALAALEDAGFEAINNLPPSALVALVEEARAGTRLRAISLGPVGEAFEPDALAAVIHELRDRADLRLTHVYLEADGDTILRRYSETRRRHPMARLGRPEEGIAEEFEVLRPLRAAADHIVDTSELTPRDLRARLQAMLSATGRGLGLAVNVRSFSYKRGVPPGADLVFDCRFLRNPHWDDALRPLTGCDSAVRHHVEADPRYAAFWAHLDGMLHLLLPAYRDEGKSHLTVAFGCTGGRHRSVSVARAVAESLEAGGWQVSTQHRDMHRKSGHRGDPAGERERA
ncbi:MAG: RNase adapter RapZ [Shimia sp.]